MKICPMCSATNCVEDDNFCYKDGTPLVEMVRCECGREIHPEHDKFCSHCGKRTEIASAASR